MVFENHYHDRNGEIVELELECLTMTLFKKYNDNWTKLSKKGKNSKFWSKIFVSRQLKSCHDSNFESQNHLWVPFCPFVLADLKIEIDYFYNFVAQTSAKGDWLAGCAKIPMASSLSVYWLSKLQGLSFFFVSWVMTKHFFGEIFRHFHGNNFGTISETIKAKKQLKLVETSLAVLNWSSGKLHILSMTVTMQ